MKRFYFFIIILFNIFLFNFNYIKYSNSKINILVTTSIIGDITKNLVKNFANIFTLMGQGVDPHLYKATQGDLYKINNSDIIFYNGLFLEGKMSDIFNKLNKFKKIYAISDGILSFELIKDPNFSNGLDPHIWFDIKLLVKSIKYVSKILQERDYPNKLHYKNNTKLYIKELNILNILINKDIESILYDRRVLITAHDAFSYFGRLYNLETKSLQGISTVSEFGIKDISNLIEFIILKNIKSIFLETSVPDKPLRAVIEGCNHKNYKIFIGGGLYSDTMGNLNTFEGSYKGMLVTNTQTIVNSLK